jgi:leader peptidase (prepilin peptidase) / N-methyltransferase
MISLLIVRAEGNSLYHTQAISFGPHLTIGLWPSWIFDVLQPGF